MDTVNEWTRSCEHIAGADPRFGKGGPSASLGTEVRLGDGSAPSQSAAVKSMCM